MLILTRHIGERIVIGDDTVLTVREADEDTGPAKLDARAPCDVAIQQQEAHRPASAQPMRAQRRTRQRDPAMGWLVLVRSVGEHIRIGHDIRLTVVGFDRAGAVRLGTEAPSSVAVHREEIYARIQQKVTADTQLPQVVYRRRRLPTATS